MQRQGCDLPEQSQAWLMCSSVEVIGDIGCTMDASDDVHLKQCCWTSHTISTQVARWTNALYMWTRWWMLW